MDIREHMESLEDRGLSGRELQAEIQKLDPAELQGFMKGYYSELHQNLSKSEPGFFNSLSSDALTRLSDLDEGMSAASPDKMEAFASFARSLSEEDFVACMMSGDTPPVELSDAEMEMLKGGSKILPWLISGCLVATGTLIGAASCVCTIGAAYSSLPGSDRKPKPSGGGRN